MGGGRNAMPEASASVHRKAIFLRLTLVRGNSFARRSCCGSDFERDGRTHRQTDQCFQRIEIQRITNITTVLLLANYCVLVSNSTRAQQGGERRVCRTKGGPLAYNIGTRAARPLRHKRGRLAEALVWHPRNLYPREMLRSCRRWCMLPLGRWVGQPRCGMAPWRTSSRWSPCASRPPLGSA